MAFPNLPSNYSVPTTLSNLTTSGPELCGIPLNGPLKKTEVSTRAMGSLANELGYGTESSPTIR